MTYQQTEAIRDLADEKGTVAQHHHLDKVKDERRRELPVEVFGSGRKVEDGLRPDQCKEQLYKRVPIETSA